MSDQAATTQEQTPETPFNPSDLLDKAGGTLAALWVAKSSIDIYREVVAAVIGGLDPKTDDPKLAAEQYNAQVDLAHMLGTKAANRQLLFIKKNVQEMLFGEGQAMPELIAVAQLFVEGKVERDIDHQVEKRVDEKLREVVGAHEEAVDLSVKQALDRNNVEWNAVAGTMKQKIEQLRLENQELANQLAGKLSAAEPPPGLPPGDPPVTDPPKSRAKAAK